MTIYSENPDSARRPSQALQAGLSRYAFANPTLPRNAKQHSVAGLTTRAVKLPTATCWSEASGLINKLAHVCRRASERLSVQCFSTRVPVAEMGDPGRPLVHFVGTGGCTGRCQSLDRRRAKTTGSRGVLTRRFQPRHPIFGRSKNRIVSIRVQHGELTQILRT